MFELILQQIDETIMTFIQQEQHVYRFFKDQNTQTDIAKNLYHSSYCLFLIHISN